MLLGARDALPDGRESPLELGGRHARRHARVNDD
jgi:hypothetical protein